MLCCENFNLMVWSGCELTFCSFHTVETCDDLDTYFYVIYNASLMNIIFFYLEHEKQTMDKRFKYSISTCRGIHRLDSLALKYFPRLYHA
jgi:hypothetical protein